MIVELKNEMNKKNFQKPGLLIGLICIFANLGAQEFITPPMPGNSNYTYLKEYTPLKDYPIAEKLASYKSIKLTADLSRLSENEKKALVYLIRAAQHADNIFWLQSYGHKDSVLSRTRDENLKKYLMLNYGPWDRLNDNKPFVKGIGAKPAGARFYPEDMTMEMYTEKYSKHGDPYSVISKNFNGDLEIMPYFMVYQEEVMEINQNLMKAADAIGPEGDMQMFEYLRMRAESMVMNNYGQSDVAWLNLKDANLDIIIGPIENYEDKLLGLRTAFEAYVLIRDKEWGAKLEKYLKFLPDLQKNLPVDSAYKAEEVGNSNSQLAVFDAVYYAGDCNAGSKTIAVNLPNDENIQKNHGTRRSQIKNVMKAKFDNMVLPISQLLIDPSQRSLVNFNAFFNNVMFHEVAHGLGIKNTINGLGTVRDALGADYSAIEECKADVLGLYMVTQLVEKKELEGKLDEYYVTFVSSIFRSVRFGASSAHGKANMITFNTLMSSGAIIRQSNGTYKIDVVKMKKSIEKLAGDLLRLQGDGDRIATASYIKEKAVVKTELSSDLAKINKAGIPLDLVFEQGTKVLGLE